MFGDFLLAAVLLLIVGWLAIPIPPREEDLPTGRTVLLKKYWTNDGDVLGSTLFVAKDKGFAAFVTSNQTDLAFYEQNRVAEEVWDLWINGIADIFLPPWDAQLEVVMALCQDNHLCIFDVDAPVKGAWQMREHPLPCTSIFEAQALVSFEV